MNPHPQTAPTEASPNWNRPLKPWTPRSPPSKPKRRGRKTRPPWNVQQRNPSQRRQKRPRLLSLPKLHPQSCYHDQPGPESAAGAPQFKKPYSSLSGRLHAGAYQPKSCTGSSVSKTSGTNANNPSGFGHKEDPNQATSQDSSTSNKSAYQEGSLYKREHSQAVP